MSAGGGGRLRVVLDLRHPFAYLALTPTRELGVELGIDIDWLPIAATPLNPPTRPAEGDDRGIRHRRHRAHAIAREIEVYGAAQGLMLRDYYRDGSAHAANLGWLWMRERSRDRLSPYLDELFRRYWAVGLDPADVAQVAEIVESHSGDGVAFRKWAGGSGPVALEDLAAEIRELGLHQSPAYVLDGEVFYGRQHLPMLRWILEGRVGPGPI